MKQILMELDILYRSRCPHIVEFYGAFFTESYVYICLEFMDGESLDTLSPPGSEGIPEQYIGCICLSVLEGLKFLKDTLSVMHRDIKPTNILINSEGGKHVASHTVSYGSINAPFGCFVIVFLVRRGAPL